MGVRFACHACAKPLNIKEELAGRRGVCPGCGVRFRIPNADAEQSKPLEIENSEPIKPVDIGSSSLSRPVASRGAGGSAVPDPLGDASISTWYVRPPSGGQYGPATTVVLRQWIDEGRVAATALLWREGWSQWRESRAILPGVAGEMPLSVAVSQNQAAAAPEHRAPIDLGRGQPSVTSEASLEAVPSSMVGNPELGKQRRERSIRRMLAIGALSVLSLTLIVALVAVVRSSS